MKYCLDTTLIIDQINRNVINLIYIASYFKPFPVATFFFLAKYYLRGEFNSGR